MMWYDEIILKHRHATIQSLLPVSIMANDKGATSPSNDPFHGIGGPMTRSKTKRVKQAL